MDIKSTAYELFMPRDPFNPVSLLAAGKSCLLPTGTLVDELGRHLLDGNKYLYDKEE